MNATEFQSLTVYTCNMDGCEAQRDCADTFCGHYCAQHEAEASEYLEWEADQMRCSCGVIHSDERPEWRAEEHARIIEQKRGAAEEAAGVRGFRMLMQAAQYGAPEAYRYG